MKSYENELIRLNQLRKRNLDDGRSTAKNTYVKKEYI